MNAEALTLKLKFREAVFGKEREEVAQLLQRELCFRAAWLTGLLPVPAPPAITLALRAAAACSLLLSGLLLLRAFVSRRLCCAFLIAHSLFSSRRI
jgi:hypothetical protein